MIAQDLCRQRVPATESIAVAMVEGACAHWRHKDKRGRIQYVMMTLSIDYHNSLTANMYPLVTSDLVRNAG